MRDLMISPAGSEVKSKNSRFRMEYLLAVGIFLLPLLCWPGLDRPFSTPKTWLLGCLDTGLAAAYLLRRRETKRGVDWQWLVWPGALAVSSLAARYVSLDALLLAVLPLPLCWAIRQGLLSGERARAALLLGSLVESGIVLLQYCRVDPLSWLGWQAEVFAGSRMRVYGTLGNPDFVAAWLCGTLPLYAGMQGTGRKRIAAWAAVALQLGAIFATGSRVFLLTLPVAAVVMAIRRPRLAKWCLAGLPVAGALLWLSPARPLDVTVAGRLYLARVAAAHWKEIPPSGYGPGSFRLQFAPWQVEWIREHGAEGSAGRFAGPVDHAHNDYVEMWVEYGPAGLCAFLGLCAWLMARAWRPRGAAVCDAGAWGGAAALLAIACVDFPFHRPAEWGLYWLLLGLLGSGLCGQRPAAETEIR